MSRWMGFRRWFPAIHMPKSLQVVVAAWLKPVTQNWSVLEMPTLPHLHNMPPCLQVVAMPIFSSFAVLGGIAGPLLAGAIINTLVRSARGHQGRALRFGGGASQLSAAVRTLQSLASATLCCGPRRAS